MRPRKMAKRNNLPQNRPHNRQVQATYQASFQSGPLPVPADLQQYENTLSGAADRILTMAEFQSQHRQIIEKKVISSDCRNSTLGLVFGFLVALSFMTAGVYCIINGHDWPGVGVSCSGLATLVGVFVYGSTERRKERENKARSF
jgi:uncharacterized membrane protein